MLVSNTINNYTTGLKTKAMNTNRVNLRNNLADKLFKKNLNANISFGWSKNVNPIEEQILDLITNPSIKTAVVASHARPDGDAYGSNIGVSGILKSLGIKVYSTIDDYPLANFSKMPSPLKNMTATSFINRPDKIEELLIKDKIKVPELSIIVDTAVPDLTTENTLKLLAKSKHIVVIDHHPEISETKTNKQIWQEAFAQYGANPNSVIYWKEERAAAAEMIGELDKEIAEESKNKTIAQYNPNYYHKYRLATASGIITDAGGVNTKAKDVDKIKIARLSDKKVQGPTGKFESITRNIFNWLTKNSDVRKNEIDLHSTTRLNLPKKLSQRLDDILSGKIRIPGVEVKLATAKDPLEYIYITDRKFLIDIAKEANKINGTNTTNTNAYSNTKASSKKAQGKNARGKKQPYISKNKNHYKSQQTTTPQEPFLRQGDIYKEFKKRVEEKINDTAHIGIMVLANKGKEEYNDFTMSIRGYGHESLEGETYLPGHVLTHGLSRDIIDAILEKLEGRGGGHENACGYKSLEGKDFKKDALPIIQKVVKENTEGKNLTLLPEELQAKIISFKGNLNPFELKQA